MGISGLLPLLAPITRKKHVSEYAGQKVGVDAYCWLHKGVYSCSSELVRGEKTDKWLSYCMNKVRLLRLCKVTPVMVFDGGHLPMKKDVEIERKKSRDENKRKGMAFLRDGNLKAANECFQRAVEVTTEMAVRLIRVLQAENIECIVAPYEADAQLAFLSLTDYIHAVITEDSDLLAFGAKRVLFKMDRNGDGQEILLSDLPNCPNPKFSGWTHETFRFMCMLSGCDYTPSIAGLGIRKAYQYFSNLRTAEKVFKVIRLDRFSIPPGYEEMFSRAELTFRHQRVFDPISKTCVPLTPFADDINPDTMDFVGAHIATDLIEQIATGLIDPFTLKPYELPEDLTGPSSSSSGLAPSSTQPYRGGLTSSKKSVPLPVQKNKLTAYFTKSSPSVSKPFVPVLRNSQSSSSQQQLTPSGSVSPDPKDDEIEEGDEKEEEEEGVATSVLTKSDIVILSDSEEDVAALATHSSLSLLGSLEPTDDVPPPAPAPSASSWKQNAEEDATPSLPRPQPPATTAAPATLKEDMSAKSLRDPNAILVNTTPPKKGRGESLTGPAVGPSPTSATAAATSAAAHVQLVITSRFFKPKPASTTPSTGSSTTVVRNMKREFEAMSSTASSATSTTTSATTSVSRVRTEVFNIEENRIESVSGSSNLDENSPPPSKPARDALPPGTADVQAPLSSTYVPLYTVGSFQSPLLNNAKRITLAKISPFAAKKGSVCSPYFSGSQ